MKITFLGAAEEVTGSKYLVEQNETKILVDCGLFQGTYKTTQRNKDEFPLNPANIKAIVLTHAHIDHSGYIPVLVKNGFKGKIYCTQATYELCQILLLDNAHIQEEAAKRANKHNESGEIVILPLYTQADAEFSLSFFHVVDYDAPLKIGVFTITLMRCSHIPGSAFVIVSDGKSILSFSGDLGGPNQLIMQPPSPLKQTDYLVLESTYGDRTHEEGNPFELLRQAINKTVARGGSVLIPAFAVGRTQTILYCLYKLKQQKAIPDIPIFLDSPMAIKVSQMFCKFSEDHTLTNMCNDILTIAKYISTVEESKELDTMQGSAIIIAGSGMVEGGRMLQHFQKYIIDPQNLVILVGYQAYGTRGHNLAMGQKKINLYGKTYEVNAEIQMIDLFSAHADYNEILEWLAHLQKAPKTIFLTHGELASAISLQKKIEERFGWQVLIPRYQESFILN